MVSKIRPGKRKEGETQFRIGKMQYVNTQTIGVKASVDVVWIGTQIRTCEKCGGKFCVIKTDTSNKKQVRDKPPTSKFDKNGLRITPYPNQKICPECKDQEKRKIISKTCEWCGKVFTPSRSHAKTCSPACRKMLSLKRKKEK